MDLMGKKEAKKLAEELATNYCQSMCDDDEFVVVEGLDHEGFEALHCESGQSSFEYRVVPLSTASEITSGYYVVRVVDNGDEHEKDVVWINSELFLA